MGLREALECGDSAFLISNPDDFVDSRKEDFAIPYFSGGGRLYDGIDHGIYEIVRQDKFELDFGQEIHTVFAAAINLGVPLLPAVPAHIGNGHAFHAQFGQHFLHRFESGWLDNRFKFGHRFLSYRVVSSAGTQSFVPRGERALPTSLCRRVAAAASQYPPLAPAME